VLNTIYCRVGSELQFHDLRISPNSTRCVMSRHVTTRYLAHAVWYRKTS